MNIDYTNENICISSLVVDYENKVVSVCLEDHYYDFDIPFDEFLKIAEIIMVKQ